MALATGMLFALANLAFADPTPSDSVTTAVSDGASTVTALITDNIGVILGVVVAFLIVKFGKRLIRAIG